MSVFYENCKTKCGHILEAFKKEAIKHKVHKFKIDYIMENSQNPVSDLYCLIVQKLADLPDSKKHGDTRKMVNQLQSYDMLQNQEFHGCRELANVILNSGN